MAEKKQQEQPPAAEPETFGPEGTVLAAPEVGGGDIAETLTPEPAADQPRDRRAALFLRAAKSRVAQTLGAVIGRPLSEWGILGDGDTVDGHMILLDLDSGEKVRALPGTKLSGGHVYANTRQFPDLLVTGETLRELV